MAPRKYRSSLREEHASETRTRILRTAAELFTTDGFLPTTISSIARQAGVAGSTVYTVFGSKTSILRALLEQLDRDVAGDASRSAIASEDDPGRKLGLLANWYRRLYSSGGAMLMAAYEARPDPTVRELRERNDRAARRWQAELVGAIADTGKLRLGLAEPTAIDRMCALCGPELYLRMIGSCGLSDDAYEQFLFDLLVDQLLAGPRDQ